MEEKIITLADAKAHLSELTELAAAGETVIITKRGKPLVKLVPFDDVEPPNLLGSVHYERENDLLAPVDESWDAEL